MADNDTASTKQNHRIPFMGPELMKERLATYSRTSGVASAAIMRRAFREYLERETGMQICPACWEELKSKKGETQYHTHNDVKVTGDLWW